MLSLTYLISFLDLLSLGILLPVAPVHLKSIGASRLLIGSLTSLHALLQISSGPLVGSWSDSKGRKPLLLQCLFANLISNLLLLCTSSLYIYIFSRIIFGLTGHVQILLRALIASSVPKNDQNNVFALLGATAGLSFVAGPLLGGVLNSTDNGFFKIAVILIIFAAINLLVSLFLPDVKQNDARKDVKDKPILLELTQAFTNLQKIDWNVFWDVFSFRFLAESGYATFFSTFGIVLLDELGATQGQMAIIISLFSMTMIVMNLCLGKINRKFYMDDKDGYKRNLHGFLGMFCTFVFLYLFAGFWTYVIVVIGMGFFRAILDATWVEMLVSRTTDSDKGTIMGSFESIMPMASLVTPIVATYIGETYGYDETYVIILAFMSAGLLLAGYSFMRNQQRIKSD